MRKENSGVRYFGLNELADAYGVKTTNNTNNNKDKFLSRHKCKNCGEPLTLLKDTNVMVCNNPKCNGIKKFRKDKEGNKINFYVPSFDVLDEKGVEIASNLFS